MLVGENELRHYGVMGMKWGVRHERKSSGSGKVGRRKPKVRTTQSTQTRSRTIDPKQELRNVKQRRKQATRDAKDYAKYVEKNRWNVSDDELDAQIKRLQKQKQLRELTKSERTPVRAEATATTKSVAKEVAKSVALVAAGAAVSYAISQTLNSQQSRKNAAYGQLLLNGIQNRYALR